MSYIITMAQPIPKWIQQRYATLYKAYGINDFTLEKTISVLNEKREICVVVLSRLRRNGWLKMMLNQQDARKKIYSLVKPEEVIIQISKRSVKLKKLKISEKFNKCFNTINYAKEALVKNNISKAKKLYLKARKLYISLEHNEKKVLYNQLMKLYNKLK